MASTFILTSSPFLLSQITLASFVPDISQPHQDAKRPYTVSESDYSVQPDEIFEGLVNTSSESFLKVLATRFAGVFVHREKGDTFKIEAEKGNIYSLNSPAELFSDILAGDNNIKRWLEGCKLSKLVPRFVVGYRTFFDAKLVRGEHRSRGTEGGGTVPLSTVSGDATGLVDLSGQAGYMAGRDVKGKMGTPGERIYAIAYRKIRVSYRQGTLVATLDQKTKWEPFAGARGDDSEDEEEMYLEANMSEDDDEVGCTVIEVSPKPERLGDAVRIGYVRTG